MQRCMRLLMLWTGVLLLAATALPASAGHKARPHTNNMHALGHSPHPATFFGQPDGVRHINSDIAFWGDLAFNGNYNGFRIIDISAPGNPKEISHTLCNGDQGDLVVWENILVRSWNSKKTAVRDCDGTPVQPGWEGVHLFDISDPADPAVIGSVRLNCGSHTVTIAGISGPNLIVYSNNSSAAGCDGGAADGDFMDIIAVPLVTPGGAFLLRREPLAGPTNPSSSPGCHDAGVIRGDANLAVCASSDTTNVFDIGANATPGGSLEDPQLLFTITEPGVNGLSGGEGLGRWHSAAFSWDGEVIILGWEPGGGATNECQESDPAVDKSAFFYDADTGAKLGQWTLPRPQGPDSENCTIHNYNVVPLKHERDVLVFGNYQAGTWVVEFTDPANPQTLGWSDPPPITPPDLGGAWSTYWYNGFLYESEIQSGLNVFNYSGNELAADLDLEYLNPQTQEFTIG